MLVVGRVVDAGREQDHRRIRTAVGRQRAQRREQRLAVLLDRPHAALPEQRREDLLHHLAAREHVGHAARHAQVVFEHHEPAVRQAHEIGPHHVDVDVARHAHADHLAPEMPAGVDDAAGNHAVPDDLPLVIDVLEEEIEGGDALRQAALDGVPVTGRDDARQQIVGEDALGRLVAAVDGEGDALVEEGQVRLLLAAQQLLGRQLQQLLVQLAVVTARLRLAVEHLVEGVREAVAGEQIRSGLCGHRVAKPSEEQDLCNGRAGFQQSGDSRPRASPVRAGAPLRTRSPAAVRRPAGGTAPRTRESGSDPDRRRRAAGSA